MNNFITLSLQWWLTVKLYHLTVMAHWLYSRWLQQPLFGLKWENGSLGRDETLKEGEIRDLQTELLSTAEWHFDHLWALYCKPKFHCIYEHHSSSKITRAEMKFLLSALKWSRCVAQPTWYELCGLQAVLFIITFIIFSVTTEMMSTTGYQTPTEALESFQWEYALSSWVFRAELTLSQIPRLFGASVLVGHYLQSKMSLGVYLLSWL